MAQSYNLDEAEVETFSQLAPHWWSAQGPFKALHEINVPRLDFITHHFSTLQANPKPLRLLDVGCGGGLLCEPLARLGHEVTGLDASFASLEVAKAHSQSMGLSITYVHQDITLFKEKTPLFDGVMVMELLEHVPDPAQLLADAVACLEPGGLLFFSTLNRTWQSWALGIQMAEKVLKWAPKGAHDHAKFIEPSELRGMLEGVGCDVRQLRGISYNPLKRQWLLSDDLHINYIGVAKKSSTSI